MISLLSIFFMFLNFKNRFSIQDARAKQSGRRTNQSAPGRRERGGAFFSVYQSKISELRNFFIVFIPCNVLW